MKIEEKVESRGFGRTMTLSCNALAAFLSLLYFGVFPFGAGPPSDGESPALSRL